MWLGYALLTKYTELPCARALQHPMKITSEDFSQQIEYVVSDIFLVDIVHKTI